MPYPKRTMVYGRNMPQQGNVDYFDAYEYLPDNWQDMERPTIPVPNDIIKRYTTPDLLAMREMFKWMGSIPYPDRWFSGGGVAANAPRQMIPMPTEVVPMSDYTPKPQKTFPIVNGKQSIEDIPWWNMPPGLPFAKRMQQEFEKWLHDTSILEHYSKRT